METNTKKGGRPQLADGQKKNHIVKISFDKGQFNLVEYKAQKAGVTVSEFCRESSLEKKISPILTPDQLDSLRKLAGMANNINQIAYVANIGHLSDIHSQATNALKEIIAILHKLKK